MFKIVAIVVVVLVAAVLIFAATKPDTQTEAQQRKRI